MFLKCKIILQVLSSLLLHEIVKTASGLSAIPSPSKAGCCIAVTRMRKARSAASPRSSPTMSSSSAAAAMDGEVRPRRSPPLPYAATRTSTSRTAAAGRRAAPLPHLLCSYLLEFQLFQRARNHRPETDDERLHTGSLQLDPESI